MANAESETHEDTPVPSVYLTDDEVLPVASTQQDYPVCVKDDSPNCTVDKVNHNGAHVRDWYVCKAKVDTAALLRISALARSLISLFSVFWIAAISSLGLSKLAYFALLELFSPSAIEDYWAVLA